MLKEAAPAFQICENHSRSDARLAKRGRRPQARVEAYSVVAGANQKLAWPVDEQGFPTAVPHESLQDRDWHPLRKGEPLWRDHEGNTVPYLRRADMSLTNRGDAAAVTWLFHRNVAAAATWLFREDNVAAATWLFRGDDVAATPRLGT